MAVKTLQSIINSMSLNIAASYPKADTSEGSIISDIVITPPAQEIAKAYEQDQQTSDDQALNTASEDGLAIHGSNLNVPRKPPTTARVLITFFSYNAPSSDVTIPAGSIVGTPVGPGVNQIQFRTLQTVTMFASVGSSYLNSSTGLYEITVAAECTTAGLVGVVGASNISTIVNPITGISGCYNSSSSEGGVDVEDTEVYRQRLALKWQGNTIGTDNGILSLVLAQTDVEDATVVAHGNSSRGEFGAIDIYVKGVTSSPYVDTFTINTISPQQTFKFTKQPIISDGVQAIIYGASGSVPAPTSSIVIDSSIYGGSILGNDQIQWASGLPSELGTVFITYAYNSLIETIQTLFSQTYSDILGANILVKWATVISIDISATIKLLAGYDSLNVTFDIQDALALFFNSLNIGAQVQQSDVVSVIANVPGVDDVKLPLDTFQASDGTITPNSFGDLDIPSSAYAVGGTINITVTT